MSTHLSLHEAAEHLGVHYMTAYRYVRLGLLDAQKVGGTWRVGSHALERFASGDDNAPVSKGARAPWAERLTSRLVAGDAQGAWGVVEAALAAGSDLEGVYLDVLSPAMVAIGDRWEAGELDVAVEHRASGIAARVVGRLGHRFVRRGRSRGSIVVGAPAGEVHGLPSAILSDLLRMRGWEVSDLGADVPTASFVYAVAGMVDVGVLGVSVTSDENLAAASLVCSAVRDVDRPVKIVMGGLAIDGPEHAIALGADGWANSAGMMNELVEGWS